MKKIIINENWDEVEVDTAFYYAAIWSSKNVKYVVAYNLEKDLIERIYESLLDEEQEGTAYFIKVPNTKQTEDLLAKAVYTGLDIGPWTTDATNQLLSREDVVILKTSTQDLTEAKKKKRKKTTHGAYLTWTTGWPAYNIAMFNHHMGTDFNNKEEKDAEKAAEEANDAVDGGSTGESDAGGIADGEASGDLGGGEGGAEGASMGESLELQEAKRYVKRYYVRPQNIFCSNKEEILKALVQVGDQNCSIYSLKSLADHDDVHLLKPSDIIYYYDDGVLYDKNHVKVMDYDLFVKHEEERKKVGNVDTLSDATFDDMYDDRLTDADLKDKEIKVRKPTHEDLELNEDSIYVSKIGENMELPPEIKLLPQNQVEDFILSLKPEEEFTVGYITPIYLYKELWEIMPIFKCTQMIGYTGVDFAQSEDDLWDSASKRIANATKQIKDAEETGRQIDAGSDVNYRHQNKLVNRDNTKTNSDARRRGLDIKNKNTILFYPTAILTTIYYAKLPGQGDQFYKLTAEQIEKYIYDNMAKIEKKFDMNKVNKKVRTTFFGGVEKNDVDIDRETRELDPLNTRYIKKYNREKIQVRALYTEQIYYLYSNSQLLGRAITESAKKDLAEEAFEQNFKSISALGEDYDDVYTCCICGEEKTGYGNNPWPVRTKGRCCDACNMKFVIPARIAQLQAQEDEEE